jgi:hypothetical protein
MTNSSTRKREREKKSHKKKERKSFETCLVLLFLDVGSPPPILVLLVGSQQHKFPSPSFLR